METVIGKSMVGGLLDAGRIYSRLYITSSVWFESCLGLAYGKWAKKRKKEHFTCISFVWGVIQEREAKK